MQAVSRPSEIKVDTPRLRVHVRTAGYGDPVVLLHGFPQTSYEWRRMTPALAKHHLVVAPDQRGFGATARPYPPRMTRALLARDLAATLDALGLGAIDLVGHDWGGGIAFKFALMYPRRVRRLVLIDTTLTRAVLRAAWHFLWFKVPGLAEKTFGARGAEFVRGGLTGLCRTPGTFDERDLDLYARGFTDEATQRIAISLYRHAFGAYRVVSDKAAPHSERTERVSSAEIRAAWQAGIGNHPLWTETIDLAPADRWRRLPIPTLWIHATALGRPNATFRRQFEHAFPNLDVREFDCGHWIPEERPDELADAILRFIG